MADFQLFFTVLNELLHIQLTQEIYHVKNSNQCHRFSPSGIFWFHNLKEEVQLKLCDRFCRKAVKQVHMYLDVELFEFLIAPLERDIEIFSYMYLTVTNRLLYRKNKPICNGNHITEIKFFQYNMNKHTKWINMLLPNFEKNTFN